MSWAASSLATYLNYSSLISCFHYIGSLSFHSKFSYRISLLFPLDDFRNEEWLERSDSKTMFPSYRQSITYCNPMETEMFSD